MKRDNEIPPGVSVFSMDWFKSATDRVAQLLPGGNLVYHVGSLMHDRKQDDQGGRNVNAVATAIYLAYERGEVYLVQRRLRPLQFEYIAVRRPLPKKAANDNRGRNAAKAANAA